MSLLRNITSGLRSLLRREQVDQELDEELRAYQEMAAEEKMKAGLSRKEAVRAVRLERGSLEVSKEIVRSGGWESFVETCWQDLRFAARMLRKNSGFTAVAVVSLALGIGGNTAIFTLLDQVLLRLLPVRNPQELVQIQWHGERNTDSMGTGTVSYPFYRDIRDRSQVFSGVLCRFPLTLSVAHQGQTDRVEGELVSGNYFQVLGVPAALGRHFTPEDDRIPSGHPLAVLSYDYWTERFGADPNVLGQTILVNDFPLTVLGVSAKGFDGLELGLRSEIRIPVAMKKEMTGFFGQTFSLTNRRASWLRLFARLAPGIDRKQAQASLAPLLQSILQEESEAPDFQQNGLPTDTEQHQAYRRQQFLRSQLEVLPAAQGTYWLRDHYGTPLRILMALVGVMLLMATVNVANLLLARGAARQRETAVRLAIGASRSRLMRQSLTEALMLSILGAAAGLLLAVWLDRVILALIPVGDVPLRLNTSPDARVLVFTLVASLATALLFGLLPAARSSRLQLSCAIREQAASSMANPRLRKALGAAQVFLSTILLLAAGLFLRSLANLKAIDPGFRPARVGCVHYIRGVERLPGTTGDSVLQPGARALARVARS